MQFIVDQRTLLKELNFLQGAVEKRATIPVLGHLLIETESNRMRLQATDLDLSLTTVCEAAIAGKGSLCVPAKKLHEIVKSLPPAKVIFKIEEDCILHLTCERARFKLNGIERKQFPEVPTVTAMTAQLPAAQLRQIIARTLFAVADQDSRYSINGVKLELTDSRLRMVATDGHRLSLVEVKGRMAKARQYDSPQRVGWYPLSKSEWNWTRQNCHDYLGRVTGVSWQKSACVGCPFCARTEDALERMRNFPERVADALMLEHQSMCLNSRGTLYRDQTLFSVVMQAGNVTALRLAFISFWRCGRRRW